MNILVNNQKVARARALAELCKRAAKNPEEKEIQERWKGYISEDEVDEKNTVEYIYGKLGGLIRTEAEEKKAKEKEAKVKKEYQKKNEK